MQQNEARLYQVFEEIGITEYHVYEHEAVFTSKEAEDAGLTMPGLNLKNLLVKDKKTGRFYLIILEEHRHMDSKHFKAVTGWRQIRFAHDDELYAVLGLTPGSVSPFGLIQDRENAVTVVLDRVISQAEDTELVNFHPNRNTATLALSKADFYRFLAYTGHPVIYED